MIDLKVNYGGLNLKNPLVVASSGISGNLDLMRRAEENGAAAVVMKTLFEEEYTRSTPTPCFSLIRRESGPINSTTFYSFEQASPWALERYAREVSRARENLEIPVIASINCVSTEGWLEYSRALEEAGASAIELNRSCPFSTAVLGTGDAWNEKAVETLDLVKQQVGIPVFPKFTPQLSNPLGAALTLQAKGAEGIVMFSRFTGLEIDVEEEKPIMHGGFAGHGGPWSIHYNLRWIAASYPELDIPISGSGGVSSGEDVVKYILAGANNVQLCTSIYMEGFQVIKEYLQYLEEFMQRKGYSSLNEFRGAVCERLIPPQEVDRLRRMVMTIDEKECSECGECAEICYHGAIRASKNYYNIDVETCLGCGLCIEVLKCPALQWKKL